MGAILTASDCLSNCSREPPELHQFCGLSLFARSPVVLQPLVAVLSLYTVALIAARALERFREGFERSSASKSGREHSLTLHCRWSWLNFLMPYDDSGICERYCFEETMETSPPRPAPLEVAWRPKSHAVPRRSLILVSRPVCGHPLWRSSHVWRYAFTALM